MTWDPNQRQMNPSPSPTQPHAQRSGRSTWLWVLLGGGGFGLLLCCGGTLGLMGIGSKIMETEVRDQLRDNPKLQEHIGELQSFETDYVGSMDEPGDDTFRYDVRGTKGQGELTVRHVAGEDGTEVVEEASLRLSDGTQVQLVP